MIAPVAIALAIGATCWLSTATSLAGADSEQQTVKTTGYNTGGQSSKLKWLPHRPVKVTADRRSVASRYVRRVAQQSANQKKPAGSAFNDPFGDARKKRQPAAAVDILTTPPTEPEAPPRAEPRQAEPLRAKTPQEEPSQVDQPLPDLAAPEPARAEPDRADSTAPVTEAPDVRRERELATAQGVEDECPTAKDFKKIADLTYDTTAEQGDFPTECPLTKDPFQTRQWEPTKFSWTASSLCHKPLYFEQVGVERYGHSWGPFLQPVISGGQFFVTVPLVPYFMGVNAPNECLYTLGYYRPGSCAPYMLDALPISIRGAIYQAGVVTGLSYALP